MLQVSEKLVELHADRDSFGARETELEGRAEAGEAEKKALEEELARVQEELAEHVRLLGEFEETFAH